MKTKLNIRQITFAALVGALYVTLCYFSNISAVLSVFFSSVLPRH